MKVRALTFLCLINEIISLYLAYNIHSWLSSTGLFFVAEYLLIYPLVVVFLFFSMKSLSVIYYVYRGSFSKILFYVLSSLSSIFLLFFGTQMAIQPMATFERFWDKWKSNINSPQVEFIQNTLKCCGFNHVKEFQNDQCFVSTTSPCLKKISKMYTSNIQIGGLTFFLHGICSCVVIFLFSFNNAVLPPDNHAKNRK